MSSEWAEQPAVPASHTTPGPVLAAQREAMGWSVEQVADQLKLAVRQVVALEAGDYAALPGPAVVRGFVRAYAKIVKLDPAPLVAMIALGDEAGDGHGAAARPSRPASFSEVRFPTNGKRKSSLLLPAIGVLLVVAAAGAAAWHFGLLPAPLGRAEAPAAAAASASASARVTALPPPAALGAAPLTSVPVASVPDNHTVQSTAVPLISVPPQSASPSAVAGVPPAPVAPAAVPAAPAAAAGPHTLTLSVREDSWIEVRPAKGAPLIARLVKGGSTESFELSQPATLVVGKPDAVSASLGGAAVALPLTPGKTFSRVNLK